MKPSITITLDKEVLANLRAKAASERRSVSQQIALIVENELSARKSKSKKTAA